MTTSKGSCTVQDCRWYKNQAYSPDTVFIIHEKTKADLKVYHAEATINCTIGSPQLVITSASGKTSCNRDIEFEDNNHDEADILMICLVAKSLQLCLNAELALSQALQKDDNFNGVRYHTYSTNLESFGQEKGTSFTCIPCIHWNRECWKVLRNNQQNGFSNTCKLMWAYPEHS